LFFFFSKCLVFILFILMWVIDYIDLDLGTKLYKLTFNFFVYIYSIYVFLFVGFTTVYFLGLASGQFLVIL